MTDGTPTPCGRWIEQQIRQHGPVPFARFMEWALYHPVFGYYTSGRVRVGDDRGDFTTSPHCSELFARCLANLVVSVDRALGCPGEFTIIEGGPGEGRLALDLLDLLRLREPHVYARLTYHLIELSPALTERQRTLLTAHTERVRHAPPTAPVHGVYFSNELVDAFPVHRLVGHAEGVRELWVEARDGQLVEVERELSSPQLALALERDGIVPAPGQHVEVRPGAAGWMGEVLDLIDRGCVLTVDYGDRAPRLFGLHRPLGTCVGYRDHRVVDDLLACPGEQDLTAHVNFTTLERVAAERGAEQQELISQREFLFRTGLLREADQLAAGLDTVGALAARQALAPLLLPGTGMGEAFKVLVQVRGVELGELLTPLDAVARI